MSLTERPFTYAAAGVDQKKKDEVLDGWLRRMARASRGRVIDIPWGFAGAYPLSGELRGVRNPVLLGCADGVGTKILLAARAGIHRGIGVDVVAMNVNDLVCVGGRPLFFLDYLCLTHVEPAVIREVGEGILDGCAQAGCVLLGGETAQHPDRYPPGEYDLAGFAVGLADRAALRLPGRTRVGDVLLGLGSSGVHSNGFSLVRRIVGKDRSLDRDLLIPTRIYVRPILELLRGSRREAVRGLAHITGGGLPENVPRILARGQDAWIRRGSWPVPEIFERLRRRAGRRLDREEMYRVFNMGVGFVVAVEPKEADWIQRELERAGESVSVIGEVIRGKGRVRFDP